MAAYVPPLKRSYIFGGICSVSATAFIKVQSTYFLLEVSTISFLCFIVNNPKLHKSVRL